ncbi:hypothetical protein BpHYR1_024095 [Brachionus plicatilis]|uniref:Uncharacterized protein n=1 Tax=Brachionus plicatilis TaxID=10195 RepID=A0A3M7Q051_BRAPC|nr:hypothetical protein BpHYR1_024095 [Brachionus plicatilis]
MTILNCTDNDNFNPNLNSVRAKLLQKNKKFPLLTMLIISCSELKEIEVFKLDGGVVLASIGSRYGALTWHKVQGSMIEEIRFFRLTPEPNYQMKILNIFNALMRDKSCLTAKVAVRFKVGFTFWTSIYDLAGKNCGPNFWKLFVKFSKMNHLNDGIRLHLPRIDRFIFLSDLESVDNLLKICSGLFKLFKRKLAETIKQPER